METSQPTPPTQAPPRPSAPVVQRLLTVNLWRTGMLALAIAAVVNLGLYWVGQMAGVWHGVIMPQEGKELPLISPVIATFLYGTLGLAVFHLVNRRAPDDPVKYIRVVGYMMLVLSFAMPMIIPTATPAVVILLNLMHITTGVLLIEGIARYAR